VDHESASHQQDCLNQPLGTSILVFCTHSGKSLLLMLRFTVVSKLGSNEDTIVAVVPFYFGTTLLIEPFFEPLLGTNSFTGTKRHLGFNTNGARGCIVENCAALKSIMLGLSSIPCEQPTRSTTNKLIHQNKIARLILIGRKNSRLFFHRKLLC